MKSVHDSDKLASEEDLSVDCLPLTPTNSPLPKTRRQVTLSEPTKADVLKAIERLGKRQDAIMEKLLDIERSVASTSTLLSELVTKVDSVKSPITRREL